MDRPSSTLRPLGTWAVPPIGTSQPVPPLPTIPPGGSRRPSLAPDKLSDTSDSEGEDTFRPKQSQSPSSGQRLTYKPSFSKPTFQWIRGEMLGKGSYGKVYLALNASTGEVMAVKQVELPKAPSDKIKPQQQDVMKALKFEGDTLKDLDHPNIVTYLGFEESQDYLSIFLEYVPGGTVNTLLEKHGRVREEVTKSWLSQILQGLCYLHSRGILHRDLKADNILVDHSGVCKITDFGISKKAAEINRGKAFTTMKGTVYWMAPEILSNNGQGYDFKVDIWSVGCVAVEMWTGKRPWYGHEMVPVMLKVVQGSLAPPIPLDIPMTELAKGFRSECFHPNPADRPTATMLLKHPYLELSSDWVYNPEDLADNLRPPRTYIQPIPPQLRESRSISTSSTIKPPLEKPRSFKPPLPTLTIPDVWHNSPVESTASQSVGPPVVFITPPSSPRKTPKPDEHSASTSASGTPDRKFPKRRLIICNPDDQPDIRPSRSQNNLKSPAKPAYIYTPPPLPEPPQSKIITSSRPLPNTATPIISPRPLPSTANALPSSSNLGKTSSPSRTRRPVADPNPSSARTTPRPLPPSPQSLPPVPRSPPPPLHISPRRRPGSSRDRSYTVAAIDTSGIRRYEEGNQTAKINLPISSSGLSSTRSARRLPISPQPPNPTPSARPSSRTVMKQKSVPDVSIFAYDPHSAQSRMPRTFRYRRGNYDSEFDESDDGSTSSRSTTKTIHGKRWGMRPRTEDVYEDLEAWFPHHNLDQPVDSSSAGRPADTLDSASASRRRVDDRKSIRMIAKEQNRLSHGRPASARPKTMLWNTRMEELPRVEVPRPEDLDDR